MPSAVVNRATAILSELRSERSARAFVWSVWLVMLLVALAYLAKNSHNIPFSEDWWLVPPLTGNEPDLVKWLWTQNNEHRIPFPRLILLAALKITHGDFRSGMFLNIIILGSLALAMIRVARQLRGGRISFADAFFPIALLHLGNWENLFWSWQFTQIVPTVLACVILLAIVSSNLLVTPRVALAAGVSLILLPLSGANGLIFVPLLALWLGYCGILQWYTAKTEGGHRWVGGFLIGSVGITIGLSGLYFVGYTSPPHEAPNPTLGAALWAAVQFLALGFGPVVRSFWIPPMTAMIALLLSSAVVVALRVLTNKDLERHRALGILVFFTNMALFAAAIGWGRAEVLRLPVWGGIWPTRYVLLAVPALCLVFFIWELYGPAKIRPIVQNGLFIGMFLLIPLNTVHGFWWRDWYLAGVKSLEQDLRAGLPHSVVAERNREFLFRWMDPSFDKLRMLREAGIGFFARIQEDSITSSAPPQAVASTQVQPSFLSLINIGNTSLVNQEFRYDMPEASEVYLVWGINGWQIAPEEFWPAGTEVKDKVMHTPMAQEGDTFVATVQVPIETVIDYCFLITQKRDAFPITWPICEGNYQQLSSNNSLIEVKSHLSLALVTQEFRYHLPEAGEVYLAWGLNGWRVAPEELWPVETEVKDKILHTPMAQEGDAFVAKLQVPVGTTINYGFLITKRRDALNMVRPIGDWNGEGYQVAAAEEGLVEVKGVVNLADSLKAPLSQEFRYHLPEANKVYLVWGIDGWHIVPEALRPAGTEIKGNVMQTPMAREGDTFITKIQVPAGATLDYGFQITERRGLFELVYPIWDDSNQGKLTISEAGVFEIEGNLPLKDLSDMLHKYRLFLTGLVTLLGSWLVIFFLLAWVESKLKISVKFLRK